jgi:menaquinone-dependent protoporphyrinogen IX oxidase
MSVAVRYQSKGGSTKKVADAIASQLNVIAYPISEQLNQDVDILFLGGAVYASNIDAEMKSFISNLNRNIGKVALFSTSLISKKFFADATELLNKKKIEVLPEHFYCNGKFGIIHPLKPSAKDLANAKSFADKIIN